MRVLVTGGAGYIGSVVTEGLVNDGHHVVVYDNLSKGHRKSVHADAEFVEADLHDASTLRNTFRKHQIDSVIHMAASSLVGESCSNPAKYYDNNVVAGLKLLDAMIESNVKRIVFSSTAATYGNPETQPIDESAPNQPTNPYVETKLAFERAMRWYDEAFELRYAALRYFNAAGATEKCSEDHDPETHLIPIALHVVDLAQAHILALGALNNGSRIYNLGCGGDGYSVKQVIDTVREVTGSEIPTKIAPRRAGDPPTLIASSDRIKRELNWQPKYQDLGVIVESAWRWKQ